MTAGLRAVDEVEVTVLIDNVSDILSSVPRGVTSEIANVFKAGARQLAGNCLCCACWGLSLVIEARNGGERRSLLFDCGPDDYAVRWNVERLRLEVQAIEAIVLSHGHWDHAGGLLAMLQLMRAAGAERVPVHLNPGMLTSRGMRTPRGDVIPFRDLPGLREIEAAGGATVSDAAARTLIGELAYLSGEIPRVTAYEQGLPGHVRRDGDAWQPDPLILDERFLALDVRDKGIVVFTACSHAGLINVLRHAREHFAPRPLYAVVGGFHLSGADCEKLIPATVADLRDFGLRRIVPGHCTGWRALHALVEAFGEEVVVPSAVGRSYRF